MKPVYKVRDIQFNFATPDMMRIGLVGTALCDVDGWPGPFVVQMGRGEDGNVDLCVPVMFEGLNNAPACLRDPEIRDEIERRIYCQIDALKEKGGAGLFKIQSVTVQRTPPELRAQCVLGIALVEVNDDPRPIMLTLHQGHGGPLEISYAANFDAFELPACLQYPRFRKEVQEAIQRELDSQPDEAWGSS